LHMTPDTKGKTASRLSLRRRRGIKKHVEVQWIFHTARALYSLRQSQTNELLEKSSDSDSNGHCF